MLVVGANKLHRLTQTFLSLFLDSSRLDNRFKAMETYKALNELAL